MPSPSWEDAAYWEAALETYHLDLMIEAWDQIEPRGVGEAGDNLRWYRLIEAEALLRSKSSLTKVNDWLTLETVPSETVSAEDRIAACALEAADCISKRLGWTHGPEVMISILCRESETTWATNPQGYWVNKDPYDKICLPHYLLDDETELMRAVAHEYAHVIVGGLSDEHAPTWLHEAISILAENGIETAAESLDEGPSKINWLPPLALEGILDSENPDDAEKILEAYEQCGWIGKYLLEIAPEPKLGELLREHANESTAKNLWRVIRGQERIDAALGSTHKLTVPKLFDAANRWRKALSGDGAVAKA